MISVGGCGGLFAAEIAKELRIGRVLVPELASVFSAFGAASADIRRERSRSVSALLPADSALLEGVGAQLAGAVEADLDADGIEAGNRSIAYEVDLRFHRQKWELPIQWTGGFSPEEQDAQLARFREEYVRRYGEGAMITGAPVELVAMRAVGEGRTVRARLTTADASSRGPAPVAGTRAIDIGRETGWMDVDVVLGEDVRPGHSLTGPAVVDSVDTTIWVAAGVRATVDQYGTIDMEVTR
jgi:N-methylhydantoinase A